MIVKSLLSAKPLVASVAGGSFDLRDANKSRQGAFKHLLLLEEHLAQDQCNECCHKHLFTAIAYLEEASRLVGGQKGDQILADALTEMETELPFCDVRPVRKTIGIQLGYGIKDGPS